VERPEIAILETDRNKKGTLFTRLAADVLEGLGYGDFRFDVAKSGREIDVSGFHRVESSRHLRAECKAEATPIGGAALNKFAGAVGVERDVLRRRFGTEVSIAPYFVSLSGFKDSTKEQEEERTAGRISLLGPSEVVQELERSRLLVPPEAAVQTARAMAESVGVEPRLLSAELWIGPLGRMWCVRLIAVDDQTHVVLIHADGNPLTARAANAVIQVALTLGYDSGSHLVVPLHTSDHAEARERARNDYLHYVELECGEIQLDGLPADESVGSKRLGLEAIFVPLKLAKSSGEEASDQTEDESQDPTARADALRGGSTLGDILGVTQRLAIVAPPGGGKSTLLKRLAIAYAFRERLPLIPDDLPDVERFPVLIKCRELGALVRGTFRDIVRAIASRAELGEAESSEFVALVEEYGRDGRLLLLIDGLDEISDQADRTAFVETIRRFARTYPANWLVATSRPSGFRAVAGAMAADFERYEVLELDDAGIAALVRNWYREVYGQERASEANIAPLIAEIDTNPRVRWLAGNPLLLTTLLLVRRWVGSLPTRRTVLYGKAIEVLLMTWNVLGHKPVDLDQAVPRLEFVAFSMLRGGKQRVTQGELRAHLVLARQDMP
jgi:stage V sporulation protein SpoVS